MEIVKEQHEKRSFQKLVLVFQEKKMRWNFSNLAESVNEDHQSHHNEGVWTKSKVTQLKTIY